MAYDNYRELESNGNTYYVFPAEQEKGRYWQVFFADTRGYQESIFVKARSFMVALVTAKAVNEDFAVMEDKNARVTDCIELADSTCLT